MSSTHAHDIQKEVKGYLIVFAALAALTVITVTISYLHLQVREAIVVALIIATIKASLVACYFMHLISEKKLIYCILIMVACFFVGLMFLPISQHVDVIHGSQFVH